MNSNQKRFLKIYGVLLLLFFSLLIPLPGTNSTQIIEIQEKNYTFELVDQNSLETVYDSDVGAIGEFDLLEDKVTLATGKRNLFGFMSVCSHEIKHIKLNGEGLTEKEEHDRISEVGGWIMPWNWEKQCVQLLDNRLSFY